MAVNRNRRSQDGQTSEETDWFRVVCWEKLAEIADQYLKKGSCVYVEGRLQIRKHIANGGVKRTAVEIVANDLMLLSAREEKVEPDGAAAKKAKAKPGRHHLARSTNSPSSSMCRSRGCIGRTPNPQDSRSDGV